MGTCGMSTWCADQVKKSFVLLLWGATCGVLFWRTYTYYKYDPSFYYVHQILGSFLCISRGSAAVLNLNCGMMLIPISRTFITLIRYCNAKIKLRTIRIMVDSCKGFHIACAYVIVFCSVIHTAGHVFNAKNFGTYYTSSYPNLNGAHYKEEEPILVALSSVPGITGVLMVLVLFLIYTSSASVVRSCNYDVFWYCHKLFAIFYLLFIVHAIQGPIKKQLNLLRHTPGCNYANVTMDIAWPEGGMAEAEPEAEILAGLSYRCDEGPQFDHIGCESWMWVAGPLVFYMTDMLWRMFRRWPRTSILNVTSLPEGVLELQLEKECFTARPGQFVLLQCPRVSEFEWHPYSITQIPEYNFANHSPQEKTKGVAIATSQLSKENYWLGQNSVLLEINDFSTTALNEAVPTLALVNEDTEQPSHGERATSSLLRVDGPFCSAMEDIAKFKVLLCIAGGMGITPFVSYLHQLRRMENIDNSKVQRLYLIWMCRKVDCFLWFSKLIENVHSKFVMCNRSGALDVRLYWTGPSNGLSIYQIPQEVGRAGEFMTKRIQQGRPIWKEILKDIFVHHKKKNIGVFTCGPRGLIHDVRKACRKHRSSKANVHLYSETY